MKHHLKEIALAGILAAISAARAEAHVTFATGSVPEESTSVISLQVPHGCDGKTTTEIDVKLPEGFVFAKPQPKPGWQIEIVQGPWSKTYDNYGEKANSGPVEIRWKGGELPDAYYDTFTIQGKVSGVEGGKRLDFPVTQICGTEGKVAWDQIALEGANPHSLKSPAPSLTVAAKKTGAHDEHAGMDMSGMAMGRTAMQVAEGKRDAAPLDDLVKVGDLEVSGAFTKAMLPGQPVGGGYLTIKNNGAADDILVAAASPTAGAVEIHEMAMQGQIMKMRKVEDGVSIPAGKSVSLTPGGFHLMFIRLTAPFHEGDRVPVTLTFKTAGKVDVVFPVEAAGSTAPPSK